jgi:hypothetical protein
MASIAIHLFLTALLIKMNLNCGSFALKKSNFTEEYYIVGGNALISFLRSIMTKMLWVKKNDKKGTSHSLIGLEILNEKINLKGNPRKGRSTQVCKMHKTLLPFFTYYYQLSIN